MTTIEEKNDGQILKVDCIGRVKTPPEMREQLLDLFEESGLPGTQFAARHGINYQTFATWMQKRRQARGDYGKTVGKTQVGNVPDEIPAEAVAAFPVTLAEVVLENEKSVSGDSGSANESRSTGLRIELPGGSVAIITEVSQTALVADLIKKLSPKSPTSSTPSSTSPSC